VLLHSWCCEPPWPSASGKNMASLTAAEEELSIRQWPLLSACSHSVWGFPLTSRPCDNHRLACQSCQATMGADNQISVRVAMIIRACRLLHRNMNLDHQHFLRRHGSSYAVLKANATSVPWASHKTERGYLKVKKQHRQALHMP
jgi:hypothetical protein